MLRPSHLALPLLALSAIAAAAPTFVDPAAPPGGNGTRERPHRDLADALRPGAEVHLLPGVHVGTWTVPARVKLRGGPGVILEAPPGADTATVLLEAGEGVTLEQLELRRGRPSLRAKGALTLRDVIVRDVTSIGVELLSGTLDAKRLRITTAAAAEGALRLAPGTHARVAGLHCEGPFARAVEASRAELTIDGAQVNGAVIALHLENVVLRATRVGVFDREAYAARGPTAGERSPARPGSPPPERSPLSGDVPPPRVVSGAALFIAGGEATLADVFVTGHEYALLGRNARVRLTRFGSLRVRRGAVTGVGTELEATGVAISQPGAFGAIQLNGGRARMSGLLVTGWRDQAVWLRGGDLHLSGATIVAPERTASGDGTALSARIGRLSVEHVLVRGGEGACLLAADDGEVVARSAVLHGCAWGLASEGVGSVRLSSGAIGAREAAAVAAAGGRVLAFAASVTPGTTAILDADCASNAFVVAQGLGRTASPSAGGGPSGTRATVRAAQLDAGAGAAPVTEADASGEGPRGPATEADARGEGPREPATEADARGEGPREPAMEAGARGEGSRGPATEADARGEGPREPACVIR